MDALEVLQCKRFKQARKILGMKQGDFAKELAISQGHASDIENERKSVSNRVMEIISLKFNFNIEWLRDGIGDARNEMDSMDIAFNHFGHIMGNASNQKKAVLAALVEMMYYFPDDKWNYIYKQFENCLEEAHREPGES